MAKKKLSEDLRKASFRGIPFQVESTDMGAGRRTQLHEYPQRDKPYVEDLGRAARDLAFTGFVVGDDYVAQANRLIGALEEAGPGTLIHPWLGTLRVSLKEPARVSFDAGLGVARLSLSFVEAGELEFPAASSSTQAATRVAASALETASVQAFADRFSIKGMQDFVASAANGNLTETLGLVSTSEIGKVLGYANGLATTVSSAIALVSDPGSLGWKVMGAFGLSGLATTISAWGNIVRSLSGLGTNSKLSDPSAPTIYTASRQQAWQNTYAINALCRQAMLAQACGASSLVGSVVDSRQPSYNDMQAVRDGLVSAIDAELLVATDAVYDALQDARLAVWQDMTARARDNARLATLLLPDVTPALVVAYDYYEDATRDADLVARNAVRHPGFVPAAPLKVLTR